ncbi:patatin-like phospholipase family protein [Oceanirhabdus sp. W0125-5]|uniref:patatin-like phospholipase family protein n=1 Tax=Oceanirhabdus sp. W0125-5 TaxID=2999116 RepID=UPI0022F31B37|nr:patatin-like phospholipase family protein [Oceanirhabdus sp. W0125-5]WBW98986.1 patatin-like phospholipase family protein [Oceanirhabdus sp. W0125-5]
MNISNNTKIADAVFEGGGAKGIGFLGALKVMEEKGYTWRNIAGNSAGAIVASLVAVGYTADELKEVFNENNCKKMIEENFQAKWMLSKAGKLIFKKGIFKVSNMEDFINELLLAKLKSKLGNRKKVKFRDLIIPDEEGNLLNNPKYKRKYKLHIIAADITRGKMLILPEDIQEYGIDPDDLDVSMAVRMSISLPFFIQPVIMYNKISKENCFIVDGGVLSNFPVWLFDVNGEPRYPTIGFKLGGSEEKIRKHKITNIINFGKSILETMLEAQDDIHISEMNYLRTIKINTSTIKTTDLDITQEKIDVLCESGEKSAKEFLRDMEVNYRKHVQLRKRKDTPKINI